MTAPGADEQAPVALLEARGLSVRIGRRFGTARGMLLCGVLASPFALLIPFTRPGPGILLFLVGGVVYVTGIVGANVMMASFTQTYVPAHMLGRNSATANLVVQGTLPLGALAGAIIGQEAGPRTAMWVSAIFITLSAGIFFIGPIRHQRDLPAAPATAAADLEHS